MSLAQDGFGGDRLVAVKVVDATLLPPRAFTQLQREFNLRRGLRHPNLAAFYELDFDDAGACRLVSEYVNGPDFLGALSDHGDQLVDLAVQLMHALGHLHDCGLVHGAIKPANVRVVRGAEGPCLKLLDFDLRPDNDVPPTESAASLHYEAPEALRGQPADSRADLYAAGMLLYQAIGGQLPFEDPEHAPGVVAWHLSRSVRRAPPGNVLSAVVERMLDPDRESRFQSAHEVIRAMAAATGRKFRSRAMVGGEQVLVTGRFVGREREVKRLSAACRRVLNGGGAQILLLLGPQGIGKTRVLEEVRVMAQMSGIRVVQAACGRERAAPLGVLRDLLQQIVVLIGPDHVTAEAHEAVLREIVPDLFEGPPGPRLLPGEHDWMRIKNGVAEFLASIAQLRPLIVLVDDIQSIDEASLSVLRWVFQHFSGCPLMLIGSVQESDSGEAAASRLVENDANEVLRLGALQASDVEQILAGVLALPGGVRELGGMVLRLTAGIPLYVEELVRALLEGQMLDVLADGGGPAADDSGPSPRERTLDLVCARIDRLPELSRSILEALCLFEGAAGEEELAAVAAESGGDVEGALRRLEIADLVRVEPTRGGARVALRSALFRDAVSRRTPPERLAEMHDRIVDRLESANPPSPERTSAIAYHAIRGTRPKKALLVGLSAAREAIALHAYDRARDLLEHARKLAVSLADTAAMSTTLELLAETLERLGEMDAALLILGEIASSPDSSKAQVVAARLKIGEFQMLHGRISAAERSLACAAEEAVVLGDPIVMSRVDRQRALILVRRASPERALDLLLRARSVLESANAPSELARVISEIGEVHQELDETDLARSCQRESLVRFLRLRDRSGVALAHLNLGLVDWRERKSLKALARLGRCERMARRVGHYALLAHALHHRGVIEAALGRLADAVRTLTLSVSMMRRLEDEPGICDGLVQLGSAHHAAGRHEMARMLIEDVIARRGRLNDLRGVASARVLLGRIFCVIGSLDDAETLMRTAADAAEQLGLDGIAADALTGLAEIALKRDRPDEALSLLDRQVRLANPLRDQISLVTCELLRAEIAFRAEGPACRVSVAKLIRIARAARNATVLVEARRLAGVIRPGAAGVTSLWSALRAADRSGMRDAGWRIRADLAARLLPAGDFEAAVDLMKEAMTILRTIHDELPVRRRENYLADPRKHELRTAFAEAVDRMGVPSA